MRIKYDLIQRQNTPNPFKFYQLQYQRSVKIMIQSLNIIQQAFELNSKILLSANNIVNEFFHGHDVIFQSFLYNKQIHQIKSSSSSNQNICIMPKINEPLLKKHSSQSIDRLTPKQILFKETELSNTVLSKENILIHEPQERIEPRLNRIKMMSKFQQKPKSGTLKVELNLTHILIGEMEISSRIQATLMLNSIIDIFIRINSTVYTIFALDRNDVVGYLALSVMLIPRFFQMLALTKLLFIKLQNPRYREYVQTGILFQQNFVSIDLTVEQKKLWYNWQRKITSNTYRKILFIVLPNEISVIVLPFMRKRGKMTFIISQTILTTIEVICFYPMFLILLYYNTYGLKKHDTSNAFNDFTQLLVYISLIKYILIYLYFLTKRNLQINGVLQQNQ